MDKKIGALYDGLYGIALSLQDAKGESKEVAAALESAKESIDSILLHRIRIVFEIPIGIDIPHDFLGDDGIEKMIYHSQMAIEKHINEPGEDSNPNIAENEKPKLQTIAESVGWGKYLSQNENITLLMAKRLKSAIQLRFIPSSHEGLSDDPYFADNLHHDTRRYNDRAGVNKLGFRSGRGRIKG